jgi:hypothetical protein
LQSEETRARRGRFTARTAITLRSTSNKIEIQYDAPLLVGSLPGLSVFSRHVELARRKLQEADAALQPWDVFLKGLRAGYNRCAIARRQYAAGLNRIYSPP